MNYRFTNTKIYIMQDYPYVTQLDVKFNHLEKIDVNELVNDNTHKWFNQTLTQVNDAVVRLGIVEGQLLIELKDRTIELNPKQGVTISKGVLHRPRAPKKTVILMVETNNITPTGDD